MLTSKLSIFFDRFQSKKCFKRSCLFFCTIFVAPDALVGRFIMRHFTLCTINTAYRFNTVNSVDSSVKESSHARQLRIRRRQSVHDVLNDKSLLDSVVLRQDNRQQVRRDTSTGYGQKLEREEKDPVVAAAMGINLQKQSLRSLTMMDLEANLEIKKIEKTLKSIPTHQQPHFHATQGSVQLHLSRIKETQRSKPKNSWLTHTSNVTDLETLCGTCSCIKVSTQRVM